MTKNKVRCIQFSLAFLIAHSVWAKDKQAVPDNNVSTKLEKFNAVLQKGLAMMSQEQNDSQENNSNYSNIQDGQTQSTNNGSEGSCIGFQKSPPAPKNIGDISHGVRGVLWGEDNDDVLLEAFPCRLTGTLYEFDPVDTMVDFTKNGRGRDRLTSFKPISTWGVLNYTDPIQQTYLYHGRLMGVSMNTLNVSHNAIYKELLKKYGPSIGHREVKGSEGNKKYEWWDVGDTRIIFCALSYYKLQYFNKKDFLSGVKELDEATVKLKQQETIDKKNKVKGLLE